MEKSTYSELLKDPRWQKKRLEILQSDHWTCRMCLKKDRTLHIHHLYYERGKMPWEYPDTALLTLCDQCHEVASRIDYKKAFWDCNLSEGNLLEIALVIQFVGARLNSNPEVIALREKWKTRTMNELVDSLILSLLDEYKAPDEDGEALYKEFFDWKSENGGKYIGQ